MKKVISSLLLIIFAIAAALTVYAHPGRTDGAGGHTNHSTGEYHYHHGYSEHDHTDMDGDGVRDCPYEFVDKTDHSNKGSTSGSSNSISKPKQEYEAPVWDIDVPKYEYEYDYDFDLYEETVSQPSPTPIPKEDDEDMLLPTWAKWIIGVLSACSFVLGISVFFLHRRIKDIRAFIVRLKADHVKNEQEIKAKTQDNIRQFYNFLVAGYGEDFLVRLSGAPPQDNIGEDGLPFNVDSSDLKWGFKYTFCYRDPVGYRTDNRLHHSLCRYATPFIVNAYTAKTSRQVYTPCMVCRPNLPDMEWVDTYNKYKKILLELDGDPASPIEVKKPMVIARRINCGTFMEPKE